LSCTWDSWGLSVIGPSHLRFGFPNQDYWSSRHYKWGDVVAIADGLGSRSRSDIGSQAACLSVFEAAKAFHNCPSAKTEDVLRLVHSYWLLKIAPYEPRECATTCLFAIRFNEKYLIAQLGDGLIAVCGKIENETILLQDNKDDSFSNFTYSLEREFRLEHWKTLTLATEQFDAVILCTDGISDDLLPDKQSDFAQELYLTYRKCTARKRRNELSRWLKNWPVPRHSDDKTVACLFKKVRPLTNE